MNIPRKDIDSRMKECWFNYTKTNQHSPLPLLSGFQSPVEYQESFAKNNPIVSFNNANKYPDKDDLDIEIQADQSGYLSKSKGFPLPTTSKISSNYRTPVSEKHMAQASAGKSGNPILSSGKAQITRSAPYGNIIGRKNKPIKKWRVLRESQKGSQDLLKEPNENEIDKLKQIYNKITINEKTKKFYRNPKHPEFRGEDIVECENEEFEREIDDPIALWESKYIKPNNITKSFQ